MSGKKPKRNGFWVFVMDRKKQFGIQGIPLPGNGEFQALANALSGDWQSLSSEQKAFYVDKAKEYNGSKSQEVMTSSGPVLSSNIAYMLERELETKQKMKADIVIELVKKFSPLLEELPIIIVKFANYWKCLNSTGNKSIPLEIAMTVFSMKNGIVDNLATLIDPGNVPREEHAPGSFASIESEVNSNKEKYQMFKFGYGTEFQNYKEIKAQVDKFIQKNAANIGGKYIFSLDEDMGVTEAGFGWLFQRAGERSSLIVLSLNLLIKLMSIKAWELKESDTSPGKALAMEYANNLKRSLEGVVCYPSKSPEIRETGMFLEEELVDVFLKSENYAYYEHLACLYHKELIEGSQFCPLNVINRHAFSLMDAMLQNFKVVPRLGFHYPRVYDVAVEALARNKMLRQWFDLDYVKLANAYREFVEKENQEKIERDKAFEEARQNAPQSREFQYFDQRRDARLKNLEKAKYSFSYNPNDDLE